MTEQQKENTRQWVAALRSRNYKQITRQLHKTGGFCCLGVACDLYDNTKWGRMDGSEFFYYSTSDSQIHYNFPPVEMIVEYYGIDVDFANRLWELNDKESYSFEQIADYIETKLL